MRASVFAWAAAAIAAPACGFNPSGAAVDATTSTPHDSGGTAPHDAPVTTHDAPEKHDSAAPPQPDAPSGPPCYAKVSSSDVKLCLEFDDPGLSGANAISKDGSPGHHDATISTVSLEERNVPAGSNSQAIAINTATVTVADTGDLTPTGNFTLLAWVNMSAPPSTNTYTVVEKSDEYLMGIGQNTDQPPGEIDCDVQGATTVFGPLLASNTWTLVACTWDGTNLCVSAATQGQPPSPSCASAPAGFSLPGDGGTSLYIGSRLAGGETPYDYLDGALDEVRIYSEKLSTSQICTEGGLTSSCD